jgi:hypothetical protein
MLFAYCTFIILILPVFISEKNNLPSGVNARLAMSVLAIPPSLFPV